MILNGGVIRIVIGGIIGGVNGWSHHGCRSAMIGALISDFIGGVYTSVTARPLLP